MNRELLNVSNILHHHIVSIIVSVILNYVHKTLVHFFLSSLLLFYRNLTKCMCLNKLDQEGIISKYSSNFMLAEIENMHLSHQPF